MSLPRIYTRVQLSKLCGLSPETLSHYGRLGYIQKPGKGRRAAYDEEARVRLTAIVKLRRSGYLLGPIREMLAKATPSQLMAWSGLRWPHPLPPPTPVEAPKVVEKPRPPVVPEIPTPKAAPTPVSPPSPLWAHIPIAPGLELHVALGAFDASHITRVAEAVRAITMPSPTP